MPFYIGVPSLITPVHCITQTEEPLFKPQNINLRSEYDQFWKITEIMPVNILGFQTHRDNFAIDFDKDKITKRFQELRENNLSNEDYTTIL
ncbi:hypothetical protein C789_5224 [Microcystis aeruginosa FACHB-905 = DIANCHI905]|uniref:Genome sequencing data, contig C323 n=2 Tax=Microcystis aeruginosa (strain PCC 7806) TaxID=267872 RepID=A8YKD5_MICA7|nr:hypothetical protein BH695_1047 [Microcystis aeruginosa PCC 7806SL]ELS44980.1 hypothetical protein C789_5224 [Microcystis aeruginosa FACHB-905 = DIANCHI905]CAO87833.1 unnamed protein product [Microcystis aeruginosa PCC 7806]